MHTCSAATGAGIPELWAEITAAHARLAATVLPALRTGQNVAWMWSEVTETLLERLHEHPAVTARLASLEAAVASGATSPAAAAHEILSAFGVMSP